MTSTAAAAVPQDGFAARLFPVIDPATLDVVAEVADNGAEEARAAVDRAAAGFALWRSTTPRERADVLRSAYELMLGRRDALVELIVSENGKSLADAEAEVTYAAEFFRWFSEEAVRTDGILGDAPAGSARSLVRHKPVGIAALVTPWNFPAAMATRKLAPALAAGCSALLKPAAETPLTALAVVDLLVEAGLPTDVVQVVTTTDPAQVVDTWTADDRVRKLSFTGSTAVGRRLLTRTAASVMNVSMELGGNAPLIVTAEADVELAVEGALVAKFRNGGQACTAANQLYVHAAVEEEFSRLFSRRVSQLTVGPARDGSDIGPLISDSAVKRLTAVIEAACAAGATISAQTAAPERGYFLPATVLRDVPRGTEVFRDELFGPVAPIVRWEDRNEMIAEVNSSVFGLAAYVFSSNLKDALCLGEDIEAGMVGVNRGTVSDPSAPFGGMKQSGIGREGARDGLREFQEKQFLSVAWS